MKLVEHLTLETWWENHPELSAWIHHGEVMLDQLDNLKAFDNVDNKILNRQATDVWTGWADSEVDWKLDEWLGPEGDYQWYEG